MREDAGPRPSPRAAERLAADVGAEVSDLRTALRRALDEAERLEAAGRQDLAASVLEEQRDALVAVHRQLSDRLAAAAVEREAENIVDAAATAPSTPVHDGTLVRLLASAAAAVAGIVLLTAPDLGGGVLEAAGWGETSDTAQVPAVDQQDVGPPSSASEEAASAEATSAMGDDGAVASGAVAEPLGHEAAAGREPKPAPAPRDDQHPLLDVLDGVFRLVPSSFSDDGDEPDSGAEDRADGEAVEGDAPITGQDGIDLGESAEE